MNIKKFDNFKSIASVINIQDNKIYFDNNFILTSYHEPDRCESHYLDFEHLKLSDFDGLKFDLSGESWFKKIEDYGIELVPVEGWSFDITECQVISE
jgi:hypothetical protein